MGTVNYNAGGNLVMDQHPIQWLGGGGDSNIPSCFMLQKL